jgi:hypothetical protein
LWHIQEEEKGKRVCRPIAGCKTFDEKGSETSDKLTVAERVEKEIYKEQSEMSCKMNR